MKNLPLTSAMTEVMDRMILGYDLYIHYPPSFSADPRQAMILDHDGTPKVPWSTAMALVNRKYVRQISKRDVHCTKIFRYAISKLGKEKFESLTLHSLHCPTCRKRLPNPHFTPSK